VAQKLNEMWGQSVVIENRGGAGGNLAARAVRSAQPDGYTVLVTTTALAINPTMYRRLDFTLDELAAVAIPAASPETIAAHPSKAPGGLKEFIAANKDSEVTFASAGVGSGSHLAAEYFFREHAKTKVLHVPFRGGSPAIQAVLGNQVDLIASSFGVTSQVVDGKLKGLAVASPSRNPAMPDVPTYKESGFDFEAESWVGFFVPAKTDPAVVAALNAAINAVVSEQAGRDHLSRLGFRIAPRSAAESQCLSQVRSRQVGHDGEGRRRIRRLRRQLARKPATSLSTSARIFGPWVRISANSASEIRSCSPRLKLGHSCTIAHQALICGRWSVHAPRSPR
jgi:tripartite-type tricarboxylate transporter receptor subunit TctC